MLEPFWMLIETLESCTLPPCSAAHPTEAANTFFFCIFILYLDHRISWFKPHQNKIKQIYSDNKDIQYPPNGTKGFSLHLRHIFSLDDSGL